MIEPSLKIAKKAGGVFYDAAKAYNDYNREKWNTTIDSAKSAYKAATPIIAEAAEKQRKKKKKRGSSGSF